MIKRIITVFLIIMIGVMMMPYKASVDSSPSTTLVYATRFLQVRSGSDKTNLTLNYTQLMSFKNYVFNLTDQAIDGMYDVDRDKILNAKAIIEMDLTGVTEAQFLSNFSKYYTIYEDLFALYSYTVESRSVEGRGIWHRPFESNLDQVRTTLSDLQAMGINMLFVETFWMGRLIYNSNVPDTFQHHFTLNGYSDDSVDYGTNLLKAFVEEGKNYGIEVHAWVENFFVGHGTSISGSPILQAKPEWASYNYDGTIPQKAEVNYLFMDPANPETRSYLKAIYTEMAETMDIASIHLDYIRYPVSQNQRSATNNRDTGYSAYAEREFKYLYGYTGDLRELVVQSAQAASDWQEYKTNIISDFVAGVYYRVKKANPEVYLSTAIFGNVENAIATKNQDWASWVEDGYVEMILPMAYYQSSTTVRNEVNRLTDIVGTNAFSYAGLASSYMGYNDHINTAQIEASLSGNAQGITFFATQNYLINHFNGTTTANQKVIDILNEGVFRQPAIVPHGDIETILEVSFDEILKRATRIYVPDHAMTQTQWSLLEQQFSDIKGLPHQSYQELSDLIETLETLDSSNYALAPANQRINEALEYLAMLLRIRLTRTDFDKSIDLSVDPDLPTDLPPLITLLSPSNFTIVDHLIQWDTVNNSLGYTLRINGETVSLTESEFDLRSINLFEGITYFEVKAHGDGVNTKDSDYSAVIEHEVFRLSEPTNSYVLNDLLYFDEVDHTVRYRVRVGAQTFYTETASLDLSKLQLNTQSYTITIVAEGNQFQYTNSRASSPIQYRASNLTVQLLFRDLFIKHGTKILFDGE